MNQQHPSSQSETDSNKREKTIVEKHIEFFAKKNGDLTTESMEQGHYCQHITKYVTLKQRAINNMMGNQPHNVETLSKIRNPASTGIWRQNGTFDEEQFQKLISRGFMYKGKRIIMKRHFMDHLKERHGHTDFGLACRIFLVVPVSWKRVTQGSIDELFEYYGNVRYKGQNAFTEEKLRDFYTNPEKVMLRRIHKLKNINPPPKACAKSDKDAAHQGIKCDKANNR